MTVCISAKPPSLHVLKRESIGVTFNRLVQSGWNVMAHGDAGERKWSGNWGMEWVVSTLQTTSENGVSSITTADAHTSAASSRLNWRPRRFKWSSPFRQRRNLFSARVPSHFKRILPLIEVVNVIVMVTTLTMVTTVTTGTTVTMFATDIITMTITVCMVTLFTNVTKGTAVRERR
jgi:hypothetical protein